MRSKLVQFEVDNHENDKSQKNIREGVILEKTFNI